MQVCFPDMKCGQICSVVTLRESTMLSCSRPKHQAHQAIDAWKASGHQAASKTQQPFMAPGLWSDYKLSSEPIEPSERGRLFILVVAANASSLSSCVHSTCTHQTYARTHAIQPKTIKDSQTKHTHIYYLYLQDPQPNARGCRPG